MTLYLENIILESATVIGGHIWFRVGDKFFPEEGWYDHVRVNFEMWLPQIISFSGGNTDYCSLLFLDGPYEIKLFRNHDGKVTASCYRDHQIQIPETEISLGDFLGSVLSCLRYFHRELFLHNMHFPFHDQLQQLSQLNKQEKNYV